MTEYNFLIAILVILCVAVMIRVLFDGARALSFMRCQMALNLKRNGKKFYKGMFSDFFYNWWVLLGTDRNAYSCGNHDWIWHDIGKWSVDGLQKIKTKH